MCLNFLLFSSSCNINSVEDDSSEVDFSKEVKVNFEYNFEVFDALIKFENGSLYFKYSDNCGVLSNAEVTINSQTYLFSNNDLNFTGKTEELNDKFLPIIIYNLLLENNGKVKTQMYDESKNCCYFEESLSNKFLRFEIYNNNKILSYVIIIS